MRDLVYACQIVCHLIGKGGAVISKVQEDSGAALKFQVSGCEEDTHDASLVHKILVSTLPDRQTGYAAMKVP